MIPGFCDRTEFAHYNPGARRIAEKASAPVKGRSHTTETTIDLTGEAEGGLFVNGTKVDKMGRPEIKGPGFWFKGI